MRRAPSSFTMRSTLPTGAEEAFAWHERPGALERLMPPWAPARVVARRGTIRDGDETTLALRVGPFTRRWRARHRDYVPGRQFADDQAQGPFASWAHIHRFRPAGAACELEDEIEYRLPLGPLGRLGAPIVERQLTRTFAFRHRRLHHDLERHAMSDTTMRVAVTGSSGLIGRALSAFLTTGGHDVARLVRRAPEAGDLAWDPDRGTIDAAGLAGVDAVVHLAGAPIGRRWNEARKHEIRSSRVEGTRLLAETLAALDPKPRVLVCASAVGVYGSRGDELLSEESPAGEDFLAEVCTAWEEAAHPAREAGIRVVNLRFGVVLESLLPRLLLPFRLGVGGRLGNGRHWLSWISLDDVVAALHQALIDDTLSGPVNAVAPTPVTNADFTRVLGRVLRRPAVLPLPAVAIRMLFGEMGRTVLLGSQRATPARLQATGFTFRYPELDTGVRHMLGR